jgi:hypothetical protein
MIGDRAGEGHVEPLAPSMIRSRQSVWISPERYTFSVIASLLFGNPFGRPIPLGRMNGSAAQHAARGLGDLLDHLRGNGVDLVFGQVRSVGCSARSAQGLLAVPSDCRR